MTLSQQPSPVRRISASDEPNRPAAGPGAEIAKLVDISHCIGCKGCEVACKEWNDLGAEISHNFGSYQSHRDLSSHTWLLMRFNEERIGGEFQWLIKKDACLHCAEPGCLFACPEPEAIVQYENGIVDFNQEHCIGCQYCIAGCPFDIPRFDRGRRKVYKCNFCIDRVEAGLEPACVKTCPTQAISYGSKAKMAALAQEKLGILRNRGFRHAGLYDPEGVGGTHMIYVLPHGNHLSGYKLPENPVIRGGALSVKGAMRRFGMTFHGTGLLGGSVLAFALQWLAGGGGPPRNTAE